MFFSISKKEFDNRFLNHSKTNQFYISLDNGWHKKLIDNSIVYFKGYCDTADLSDIVKDFVKDPTPRHSGNFCLIIINDNCLTVTHDYTRSFKLESVDGVVTNFTDSTQQNTVPIWTDSYVKIVDSVEVVSYENSVGEINQTLSLDECVSQLHDLLKQKTQQLDRFGFPLKVYLSGGVDTMMAYSIIENYYGADSDKYQFVTEEHCELTPFLLKNFDRISTEFWAYNQTHHWKTTSVLATGGCGDEMFLRGPNTAAMWCAWNNYNVLEILSEDTHYYHKKYFLKDSNKKYFENHWNNRKEIQKLSYNQLCGEIYNNIANDHQHWHLENTINWTPLKDLRILKTMLQLRKEDLLGQILNGNVDRAIIKRFNSALLNYICVHKNHNQYENLLKFEKYMESIKNVEL
jgi:hypothetical protein